MKLLRIVLLFGLGLIIVNQFSSTGPAETHIIEPIENRSYRSISLQPRAVALLPQSVVLTVASDKTQVDANSLGVSVAPNLTLAVDYQKMNSKLDSLGIDSMASSTWILSMLSRGAKQITVVAKPKPIEVPDAITPVKPAVPAPAPVMPLAHAHNNYTYCVATRGVDPSFLPELEAKLAAVYSDARGWSLGGVNTFTKSTTGCGLVVWLSAAEQMPTFGAICDSTWSCTVYPNVILNFDRWRYGSPAWNASVRSLDDYRTMVINHETGHWFGFGHRFCSGAGQLAPVMQQQSINLQGCAPNPWPLESEKAAL